MNIDSLNGLKRTLHARLPLVYKVMYVEGILVDQSHFGFMHISKDLQDVNNCSGVSGGKTS